MHELTSEDTTYNQRTAAIAQMELSIKDTEHLQLGITDTGHYITKPGSVPDKHLSV